MIIALPVNEKNLNEDICVSFARAPYFAFYDSDTKKTKFIVNEAADAPGGAGIKAAQTLLDNNIDVLLTIRLGENSAEILVASKLILKKANNASAEENIIAYSKNLLPALTKFHAGFHGAQ